MQSGIPSKSPRTLTDILRRSFKGVLEAVGGFFLRLGLTPNAVTVLGLVGALLAAGLLAAGYIVWGGILLVVMAPFDAVDGAMARLSGKVTRFGALLDSTLDRFAEIFLLGGLLVYYMGRGDKLAVVLAFLAMGGSLMVSYVKARAESLNFEVKIGLLSRVERLIVLIICLLINQPMIALWILAILANFTAVQRLLYVLKVSRQTEN